MPNKTTHRGGSNKSGAKAGPKKKGKSGRGFRGQIKGDAILKKRPNTSDAVTTHNKLEVGESRPSESAMSEGGETCATFLSGPSSDCTNVALGKIHRYWRNNQHKEVRAVLAAITEVIRVKDGTESLTDYFVALITALETIEELEPKAAIVQLISMTISSDDDDKVPLAVLQSKFGKVSQLLCEMLKAVEGDDMPTAMAKSTISTLSTLICKISPSTWTDASCQETYNMLLKFISHPKPKCRKAAQDGVANIVCPKLTEDTSDYHPATTITAEYCNNKLGDLKEEALNSSEVCHIIQMMGRVMHVFPLAHLQKSCELIMSYITQPDVIIKSVCIQTVSKMFMNAPSTKSLPIDLNSKILNELYHCQPNLVDEQLSRDWLNMMAQGVSNLLKKCAQVPAVARMSPLKHVEKFCNRSYKLLISREVSDNAYVALQSTLKELGEFDAKQEMETNDKAMEDVIKSLAKLFMTGLNNKYQQVWDRIFKFYQIGFESFFNKARFSIFAEGLTSMANLHNTANFSYSSELNATLGAAVKHLGPGTFLEAVPLLLFGTDLDDKKFSRSWVIPLLKQHVCGADLTHFFDYFCPLADSFDKRAAKGSGSKALAATYKTLAWQCWGLLAVYCQHPVNLKIALKEKPKVDSFKNNAELLGQKLSSVPRLKGVVMQSLRNLINYATEKTKWEEREEDRQVLKRYGPNFLPMLFFIYVNGGNNEIKSQTTLAALETIRQYVHVMSTEDVVEHFNIVKSKIFDSNGTMKDQELIPLYDLIIVMVQWLDVKSIQEICEKMESMLGSNNHDVQKKAYRVFEEVCGSDNESCKTYLRTHGLELVDKFKKELQQRSIAPSSKGARIRCMEKMVANLSSSPDTMEDCKELVRDILPECISCLRDAEKSRKAAFALLVTSGRAFEDSLDEFFTMAFQGLNGSPDLASCSIFALSCLLFEYKDKMSPEILDLTITNVCVLLATDTREICKAALGFVMVIFSFNDNVLIKGYYKTILKAMHEWKGETQRHFRDRCRSVLQRLVRKLGFNVVSAAVRSDDLKRQLNYVQKMNENAKKKKAEGQRRGKDGDSNDNDDEDSRINKKETIDEILAHSDDGSDVGDVEEKEDGLVIGKTAKRGAQKGKKNRGGAGGKRRKM